MVIRISNKEQEISNDEFFRNQCLSFLVPCSIFNLDWLVE